MKTVTTYFLISLALVSSVRAQNTLSSKTQVNTVVTNDLIYLERYNGSGYNTRALTWPGLVDSLRTNDALQQLSAPVVNAKRFGLSSTTNDNSAALQAACDFAAYSNSTPADVYIPAGTWAFTNTVNLNYGGLQTAWGARTWRIYGDGSTATKLVWSVTNRNGLYIPNSGTMGNSYNSKFRLTRVGLIGPNITYSTNNSGFGLCTSNGVNWYLTVDDCLIAGWKSGLWISNSVFLTVQGNIFQSNWWDHVEMTGCDSVQIKENIFLQPGGTDDLAAVVYKGTSAGAGGAGGMLLYGNECGDSQAWLYNDWTAVTCIGGNYERLGCLAIITNRVGLAESYGLCQNLFVSPAIIDNDTTHRKIGLFNLYDGAAERFELRNMILNVNGTNPPPYYFTNIIAEYDTGSGRGYTPPQWYGQDNTASRQHVIYNTNTVKPYLPLSATNYSYLGYGLYTNLIYQMPLTTALLSGCDRTWNPGSDFYHDLIRFKSAWGSSNDLCSFDLPANSGLKTYLTKLTYRCDPNTSPAFIRLTNVCQRLRTLANGSSDSIFTTNAFWLTNYNLATITISNYFPDSASEVTNSLYTLIFWHHNSYGSAATNNVILTHALTIATP